MEIFVNFLVLSYKSFKTKKIGKSKLQLVKPSKQVRTKNNLFYIHRQNLSVDKSLPPKTIYIFLHLLSFKKREATRKKVYKNIQLKQETKGDHKCDVPENHFCHLAFLVLRLTFHFFQEHTLIVGE